MTRQEANRRIIRLLSYYVDIDPDMRFCQLLYNLGVVEDDPCNSNAWVDEYYTESVDTLEGMADE